MVPASTQPAEGSSPGWKRFNNTYNRYERPCDCHEHDRGKCGERGGVVCSQGTAKAAGWSEEPWGGNIYGLQFCFTFTCEQSGWRGRAAFLRIVCTPWRGVEKGLKGCFYVSG